MAPATHPYRMAPASDLVLQEHRLHRTNVFDAQCHNSHDPANKSSPSAAALKTTGVFVGRPPSVPLIISKESAAS
eukprot:12106855-Prorocentrum_lima.AAC.1